MKKFAALAAVATLAVFSIPAAFAAESSQTVRAATEAASGSVAVNAGKMLYAGNGQRIAPIYRVSSEGNPQVILNGKLVTVPASTLSDVDGKVTTSLTKQELGRAQ
ncbi:MAG: hypothetical protein LBV50_06555 [Novosphingobium sp.]|jgi:hypothetical protein|nr:hypothetical protein [Novosphingobium sp.]